MREFPWLRSYPNGVRYDLELERMPVWKILDDAVEKWPDHPAIDFKDKKFTYRELGAMVDRAAANFQRLGVKPGVNVGLYLPNTPHYIVAFFGILKAGGTVVNYSPLDTARNIGKKIEDSETDLVVTLDVKSLYPVMNAFLGKSRLKALIIGNIGEMTPHPELVNREVARAGQAAEVVWDDARLPFRMLLEGDGSYTKYPIADLDRAVAVLQYTGGTSGEPKAAMLSHANLSVASSQYVVTARGEPRILEEGRERVLGGLPLFHIYALCVVMLLGIRLGAEIVLLLRFEVEPALDLLVRKKITIFLGVPSMYSAIVNRPKIEEIDFSALRFCGCGGAPLPLELEQRFQSLSGCSVCEGWGMTETSPTGTFSPNGVRRPAGSCGLPMPNIRFKFVSVDDPTKEVALGERGEICVAGPNVMKGYWKNPAATAAAHTEDGFLRTGDVGFMDENGFVYIVDRCKDMLLCGGYNVYPRNIEEAIYEHPSVAEVSVIGIHDEYRGQSPKAFVKLKPGAPEFTLEELKAFLEGRVGKHEMVQALAFRAELPKTPVGKLSKKELYEEEARGAAGR